MTAVLWHIEVSNFNEKARWALDYKAIPHVRRAPLPGVHEIYAAVITRGRRRRLPILVLDGRAIGDSTAIIAALEEYRPDPPLYPADPAQRERALALEDYFDEHLAPAVRAFNFHHILKDPQATVEAIFRDATSTRARAMRAVLPVMAPIVRRDYGASEGGAERAVAEIRSAMDRIEAEIQPSGYLGGDAFGVADLAAAALITPLLAPPGRQYQPPTLAPAALELRAELEGRDGARWVDEMYARHRGVSAEVPG
jgi:glutathione S-transferase